MTQQVKKGNGSGYSGIVQTIVAGTNITVDNSNPTAPIISASALANAVLASGAVIGALSQQQVFTLGVGTAAQNALQVNPYGAAAGNTGEIRFYELAANGTNYLGFKAPDAIAANLIYVLPTTPPTAGQVLTAALPSGGTSVLSWTTNGAGDLLSSGTVTGATAQNQIFTLGVKTDIVVDNGTGVTVTSTGVNANSFSIELKANDGIINTIGLKGDIVSILDTAGVVLSASFGNGTGAAYAAIGDTGLGGNKTILSAIDGIKTISAAAETTLITDSVVSPHTLGSFSVAGGVVEVIIGDVSVFGNGTKIAITDSASAITATAHSGMIIATTAGNITLNPDTGYTTCTDATNKTGVSAASSQADQNAYFRTVCALLFTRGFIKA